MRKTIKITDIIVGDFLCAGHGVIDFVEFNFFKPLTVVIRGCGINNLSEILDDFTRLDALKFGFLENKAI